MFFWAAACLLLFWALGDRSLWGSEGRWAEVTREMFLTRDFFHPRINGEAYFDKPLLSYWLVALVSSLTGRLNEWAVRLPSAFSGLAGLWATVYLGRRLWSEEVGRTAGWLLLTTFGMLMWSRTGEADMENLAAITLAVAWYWARRDKSDFLTYLVFYLICFVGAHTKGLAALVVPFVAVCPDLIRGRRWRSHLNLSNFLALALGSVIYLAPFIYANVTQGAYGSSGLALVFRENIQRFINPFDHVEPFYAYFHYLPRLLLPWTPLSLTAILGTFLSIKKMNQRTRWLLEAVVLIFLLFTASGSRRSYYILPILPFCALLTAVFLKSEGKETLKRVGIGLQFGILALVALFEALSPAIWPLIKERVDFVPPTDLVLATSIVGLSAFVPLAIKRLRPGLLVSLTGTDRRIAALFLMATILTGGFFCRQQVSLDVYRTEKPFALELKENIAGLSAKEIAFYVKASADVLFYLNMPEPIQVLEDIDSLRTFLESNMGVRVLVAQREHIHGLGHGLPAQLREQPTVSERFSSWDRRKHKKHVAWIIRRGGRES